jgi:hypothetical protein
VGGECRAPQATVVHCCNSREGVLNDLSARRTGRTYPLGNTMNKHRVFLVATVVEIALLLGLVGWCRVATARWSERALPARRDLVRALDLTDLALWTEARYTRHPSQADRFAPFQDSPGSLEHFPAGSVVAPPTGWQRRPVAER